MRLLLIVGLLLVSLLVLAGCSNNIQQETPEVGDEEEVEIEEEDDMDEDDDLDDEEECLALGGEWQPGRDGFICNFPTADSGVECTDSSQCESYCEAPEDTPIGAEVTGECYGYTRATCMQVVGNGIAGATWCQ